MTTVKEVVADFKKMAKHAKPGYKEGMARFGIASDTALGISVWDMRKYAKKIAKDHELALALWKLDIHEAKVLAPMIDEPDKVTEKQMDSWVNDFYSWDICDLACSNLLDKTPFYKKKIREYVKSDEEFVKRAGFVLMAAASVHDSKAPDKQFLSYLPIIKKHSTDGRNFVRKAVNWALRQIGKRNARLHKAALKLAKELKKSDDKTARWIGSDAARELDSPKIRERIKKKQA